MEGSTDQVDVLFNVKERPTGALLLGVGFSSVEKVALSTSVRQSNAFGTGKFLPANVNAGSVNTVYSLSYLDPYYTVDGVSQGFDIYKRKTDASEPRGRPPTSPTRSAAASSSATRCPRPARSTSASTSSRRKLDSVRHQPDRSTSISSTSSATSTSYASLSAGVARDTRDSILPTRSRHHAAPRHRARRRRPDVLPPELHPPAGTRRSARDLSLLLRTDLGYADGLGGKPLPFFKSYYAGGPDSVRGYRPFSLGPRDVFGNSIGGNVKVTGGAELLFPVPGADRDQSLRLTALPRLRPGLRAGAEDRPRRAALLGRHRR